MKKLCTLSAALVLATALTFPTFAGDIGTGIAPSPTPNATGEIGIGATDGNIRTGVAFEDAHEPTPFDSMTEAALILLQSLLALF